MTQSHSITPSLTHHPAEPLSCGACRLWSALRAALWRQSSESGFIPTGSPARCFGWPALGTVAVSGDPAGVGPSQRAQTQLAVTRQATSPAESLGFLWGPCGDNLAVCARTEQRHSLVPTGGTEEGNHCSPHPPTPPSLQARTTGASVWQLQSVTGTERASWGHHFFSLWLCCCYINA